MSCVKTEPAIMRATNHGYARNQRKTPTYKIWVAMRSRCHNHKVERYPNYGGRGIRVCEGWTDVENCRADMGERPEGMSIDRINNDGDYCPEKCRWATNREQCRNQRQTVTLTSQGQT